MATAVIRTGGKQYRVAEGDVLQVEKLAGAVGDTIRFGDVLMVGGEPAKLGKPAVSGAEVQAEIVRQARGPKLVIFKFKRRKRYRRKTGHRQALTTVRITSVKG